MVHNIFKNKFDADAVALKFKDASVTYGQLDNKVDQYAQYFSNIGVKKGERVVLSCLNSPEFIYSYFGVVKLGATVVPINLLLTLPEMTYVVKNSEAKTMLVHPTILEKLKKSDSYKKKALASFIETGIGKALFRLITGMKIVILDDKFKNKVDSLQSFSFEEAKDDSLVSTFLYTSGTTGKPKAAMLTHKNLVSNTIQSANTLDFHPTDNFMCVLPMFHVFAFTVCVLLPLYNGSTITILEMFQPKETVNTLANEGITVFAGVPSMYVVILEAAKKNITFPKLRLAISGGASLPVEVFRQLKEKLNLPIVEGYGLSEASPAASFNPVNGVQKEGSIGLPIWGVECKIFDENDNELPQGQVGELVVRGDNVMLGYFKAEEQSKDALRGGWLHTGDLAKKDEDGYIFIVDRKKDMVIVGGLNVYPREVEEVIYQHPKVKETAVVGFNDKIRGEYVKAFVVLKEGQEMHSKELLRFLKDRLALYKIPREIEFTNDLPKNATGKILKRMLKQE